MSNMPTTTSNNGAMSYLADNDEIADGIDSTIDRLSRNGSPLTRWRLQRAKNREAVKLNETAMVEYMAARRRILHNFIAVEEDFAKKRILTNSLDQTKAIEKEIARIIAETVAEFENLITGREKLALMNEADLITETRSLAESGKIPAERAEQRIAKVQESTDKVVEAVESSIRQMLANLRHRFDQALDMN